MENHTCCEVWKQANSPPCGVVQRSEMVFECEMQPVVCIITHKQRCNVNVVICKVFAWFSIGVGFCLPVCPGQPERPPLSVIWGFLIVDELTKEGGNKISLVEQHFCLRAHHVVTFTRYFQRVPARKYLMMYDKVGRVSNIDLSQSVLVPVAPLLCLRFQHPARPLMHLQPFTNAPFHQTLVSQLHNMSDVVKVKNVKGLMVEK